MRIAVLALQGAFVEHRRMLDKCHAESFEIRQLADWNQEKDGIIIPGGESTTMAKLLDNLQLLQPIREAIMQGLPAFGTCAGLIMLAKRIDDKPLQRIATMDIYARRNAYGRQLGSFSTTGTFTGIAKQIPMTFIRAPYIESVSNDTEILSIVDGKIVAAKQGNQLVTAFHPELNDDTSVHSYFLKMIKKEENRGKSLKREKIDEQTINFINLPV